MVKHTLDSVFSSLSDPTRRDILRRLAMTELSISAIAEAYKVSLVAISKHLKVLEHARLITRERRGRQYFVRLAPTAFKDASDHLHYYQSLLNQRLDALEAYLQKEGSVTTHPKPTAEPSVQKLTMTHIFDAPRTRVWAAYTDPQEITKWWGPKEATLVSCISEAKVGGKWRFVLRGRDNQEYIFSGIFRDVRKPTELVYTDGFGEADTARPEALVRVTFQELPDGRPVVTKTSIPAPAVHQLQAVWLNAAARTSIEAPLTDQHVVQKEARVSVGQPN